jgi:hypothetical protein
MFACKVGAQSLFVVNLTFLDVGVLEGRYYCTKQR